jgi:hypothetical protein
VESRPKFVKIVKIRINTEIEIESRPKFVKIVKIWINIEIEMESRPKFVKILKIWINIEIEMESRPKFVKIVKIWINFEIEIESRPKFVKIVKRHLARNTRKAILHLICEMGEFINRLVWNVYYILYFKGVMCWNNVEMIGGLLGIGLL